MGAQRIVQNNGNVEIEPKYLACDVLSTVKLSLVLFFFFVRVASRRLRSILASALDSAKYVRCEGPAVLSSRPPSPKTSSCNARGICRVWYLISIYISCLGVTSN